MGATTTASVRCIGEVLNKTMSVTLELAKALTGKGQPGAVVLAYSLPRYKKLCIAAPDEEKVCSKWQVLWAESAAG